MKQFFNDWKMKHPTDRDFLHIAQKVSGMDLKWFHHYWINTTKTIDYSIENVEYGPYSTTITLTNNGQVPMPIDFSMMLKDKTIVNYNIPLNMTRVWKTEDINGKLKVLDYWPWTRQSYTFSVPYRKDQLSMLGIDFSARLADVNPENNTVTVN